MPSLPRFFELVIQPALEPELKGDLNQTRVVHGRVHDSELLCVYVRIRQAKLRVIKQIEKFGAEIQLHPIPIGQLEMLDQRKIGVYEIRPVDGSPIRIPEFTCCGWRETGSIKPFAQRVMARLARASLIRAIGSRSILLEIDTRFVVAVDYENREAREHSLDYVDLPISKNRVHGTVPFATKPLPLAER